MNTHYGKVTEDIIAQLRKIVGEKNVLTGEDRENYARDETLKIKPSLPEVVVKPGNTEEVAGTLKLANRQRIPVTPRGAGTGLSGGAVPILGGIVLSMERMNRILEIDEDNFSATVEPGVPLAELYQAVEARGLYYPLYPGEKTATIGGNVATNAGGMRAVKYGVTRNYVLGLEAVLPTGEIVHTGGKYTKCSTAYDLTQLITGSEGTLAVITKVILRLITPPGLREILFIPFHALDDAIKCVPLILKEKILPVGIEFLERDIIQMVEQYTGKEIHHHQYPAFLLLIVESDDQDEFAHVCERISEICLKHGAVDVFVPSSEHAKRELLEAREKFYTTIKHFGVLDIADAVVPRSKIPEFVAKVKTIGTEFGMNVICYGHAGDGNVHLHPIGKVEDEAKVKELFKKIYQAGIALGGTISGEHGLGFAKKGYLPLAMSKEELELLKRVKHAFDPNNIMNPGKVVDT